MKKITYLILLISTFSFISCNRYKGNNMKAPEYGIVTDTIILKGIEIPLDTILFRYAYRMRVQGNKAVIMDLHNTIVGFYVDEKTGLLFGLDVNADEQIVKYII